MRKRAWRYRLAFLNRRDSVRCRCRSDEMVVHGIVNSIVVGDVSSGVVVVVMVVVDNLLG